MVNSRSIRYLPLRERFKTRHLPKTLVTKIFKENYLKLINEVNLPQSLVTQVHYFLPRY